MSVLLNLLATTFSISDVTRTSAISLDNNEKTKFFSPKKLKPGVSSPSCSIAESNWVLIGLHFGVIRIIAS